MKRTILAIGMAAIMFSLINGCDEVINTEHIAEVKVYKCKKQVEPKKRKLLYIGNLSPEGVNNLQEYIQHSKSVSKGYIISEYYLELLSHDNTALRRIGVVISNGDLKGLDLTTKNPENAYVTTNHDLIICHDTEICNSLLKSIYSVGPSESKE